MKCKRGPCPNDAAVGRVYCSRECSPCGCIPGGIGARQNYVPKPPDKKHVHLVAETARALKISEAALRNHVARNIIPSVTHEGRRWFCIPDAIEAHRAYLARTPLARRYFELRNQEGESA
jgi:hypothetical protein